jgi:ATP-dependent RNA helicase SUPV3L1/SUV3
VTLQAELKKEMPVVKEAIVAPAPELAAADAPEAEATEGDGKEDDTPAHDEVVDALETSAATAPAAASATGEVLFASPLQGVARGLAYQLYENLGSAPRLKVTRELKGIGQEERAPLRRLGVRFGAFSIYLPVLVKPAAAKLKALLWAVHQDITDIPPPPPAGLTSLQAESTIPAGFYEAAGYRVCGPRAVRIDMLERVGELIRGKGQGGKMPDHFSISPDMMSVLGCGEEDLSLILRALGLPRRGRRRTRPGPKVVLWHHAPASVTTAGRRRPRPQASAAAGSGSGSKRGPPATTAAPYGAPFAECRCS